MNASRVGARSRRALVLLLQMLVLLLMPALALAGGPRKVDPGNGGNSRVFPPGSRPYGSSYAEWTVKWWQWAYGLPVAGHPLFDETGADCATGQSGPVWFLGGVFNVSGSAVRDLCTVPAGRALFFPIVNVEWDNVCPPGTLTETEMRDLVTDAIDSATGLVVEVDGTPIGNLSSYRFPAPSFGVDMPAGSIFDLFCGTPAGHYEPLVPDGYYVMLTPLPPGPHTIHFTGTIASFGFTLDITYDLTVGNEDGSVASAPNPVSGEVNGSSSSSWGRVKAIYR